ncbi:hypothetical protein DFR58_11890 [Anaerobacterium chartisolvens]|uniref:Uncharacterized protein n=1 Tax=Anaerobacterium chartisolvens TaxID=1297424 RepID=A0A369AV63_9FIRM|nr:hypothetical protein [Anaerobacterium chartisolvens]RCX13272.1 hypothetical protein DFR58_11890 [Anaerobacterium chartisolvens]
MAEYTTNLNLEKPLGGENLRRQVINDNMDRIDAAVFAAGSQAELLSGRMDALEEPTYSVETTYEAPMLTLPQSTVTSVFDKFTVKGRTYTNLFGSDGDCEDASKWLSYRVTKENDATKKVFGTQCFKGTIAVSDGGYLINKSKESLPLKSNTYYMLSAYVCSGTLSGGCRLTIETTPAQILILSPTSFTRICKKATPAQIAAMPLGNNFCVALNGNKGEYGYVDGVMLNEITADDYNNLTDAELMAKYPYINETQSSGPVKVTSIGKNIISTSEEFWEQGTISINTGINAASEIRLRTKTYLPINAGSVYTLSTSGWDIRSVIYYDAGYNYVSNAGELISPSTITVPIDVKFCRVIIRKYNDPIVYPVDITSARLQIELGTTATNYEPYTETASYIQPPQGSMKSVGGVSDKYDVLTGENTQNICGDWVELTGDLDWYYEGQFPPSKAFKLFNFAQEGIGGLGQFPGYFVVDYSGSTGTSLLHVGADNRCLKATTGIFYLTVSDSKTGFLDGYVPSQDEIKAYFYGWQLCNSDGSTPYSGSGTKYWKKITDGTGLTSMTPTASYAGYTPYKIIYQLATPIVTYGPSKQLIAEPNGTITVEPAITNVGVVRNGYIEIEDSSRPIQDMDFINAIDIDTGIFKPIPLDIVAVRADRLAFAVEEAPDGTYYEYGYYYDSTLTTIPAITEAHATNLKAQADSNTKAIGRLSAGMDKIDAAMGEKAGQDAFSGHLADYVRQPGYAETTGGANAYLASLSPIPAEYTSGMGIAVKINVTNTGASTINVDGLGAKSILDSKGNAMTAGKLKSGSIYSLKYNGVNFILQGEGGGGTAGAGDVLSGKTFTNDAGDQTGILALTGTATINDVVSGKTFYNTNAKTKLTGTGILKRIASGTVNVRLEHEVVKTFSVSDIGFRAGLILIGFTGGGASGVTSLSAVISIAVNTSLYYSGGMGVSTYSRDSNSTYVGGSAQSDENGFSVGLRFSHSNGWNGLPGTVTASWWMAIEY